MRKKPTTPRRKIVGATTKMVGKIEIAGDLLECGHFKHFAEDRNGHLIHGLRYRCCFACGVAACA